MNQNFVIAVCLKRREITFNAISGKHTLLGFLLQVRCLQLSEINRDLAQPGSGEARQEHSCSDFQSHTLGPLCLLVHHVLNSDPFKNT